ncbi:MULTISPECIES: hypothetical protein [Arthrobacter]|uniref:Uncharacterized protein n=1 Tax=Arthrobacter terricola TaxID=2547396 RepID=A0A4R5KKB1_9MICC|nr:MULTISPECIES: hypothetical protein [Arthrobacter]MBT8161608.1 hypothetical protein [Arthrobacter sp. GN70]TDF95275.1 hypothetical protein E1809_12215 [Arthrobacter terricola]
MTGTGNNRESETVINVATVGKLRPEPSRGPERIATSCLLWIAAYLIMMALVALRLPLTRQHLSTRVPEDVKSELGDDRLLQLSMTVGTVVFFLVYAVIIALYFSLASVLDKRIIPAKCLVAGRFNVGAFFVIAVLSTIPVNLFSVVFGVVQPRDVPGYWVYFPSMAILVLAFFFRHWRHFPPGRKVLVVLTAIGLASIVAVG